MAVPNDLIALVRRKQEQITKLQAELDEVRQLLSGRPLEPAKLRTPRNTHQPSAKPRGRRRRQKRPESSMTLSAEIISKVGRPLHADKLIERIKADYGKDVEKQTLVSGLSRLVKLGERFTRTGPNTFGLIGMEKGTK